MELRHLRYFYETANEMNFTKAAEKLCIAQPPLSKQIKDLENELGVSLFVRKPHFLALTPEGEVLKQYAAQILGLADKASETLQNMGSGLHGVIDIACVEGNILRFLSECIAGFEKIHPAVRYNIWTGGADDIISRVRSGLSDFGIIADVIDADGIEHYRLFKENWTAIVPCDNPLSGKEDGTLSAEDLLPYELIIPTRTDRLREINDWYKDSDDKPRIICRYTNVLTAYELSCCGVGISIFPGNASEIAGINGSNRAVCMRISDSLVQASMEMISNKYRMLPNVVSEFMSYIKENVDETHF